MNMTMKEMILQLGDKLVHIEKQMQEQKVTLDDLTKSTMKIAEAIHVVMEDFYNSPEASTPTASVRVPIAVEGDILDKLKDPDFMKELKDKFKKETESLVELEDELEKIQDQITKGIMGES